MDLEAACLVFSRGIGEGVDAGADLDVDEARLLEEVHPACARQAAGDSAGPEVDLAAGALWNFLSVGDAGEVEEAARAQPHLAEFEIDLAQALAGLGRSAEVASLLRRAATVLEKVYGPDDSRVERAEALLASCADGAEAA